MAEHPQVDMVIRGNRIVFENGMAPGCIGIQGGKIVFTGERDLACGAARELDAGDGVVLPGVVDPHVHFKDPGPNNHREDYASGTR